MGGARSGIAAALLLARRGARVTLTDLRPSLGDDSAAAQLSRAGVVLELGGHSAETLASASMVVLSPGVSPTHPLLAVARGAGASVIGEVEMASRWLQGRVVAITGTKGKSTTTVLAGRMLEAGGVAALVGGNIGVPLSAQVAASTPETVHVVEVSSFQLETVDTFHPWIAVLLNISPDHLDRHASVDEYASAKARVFQNQTDQDWAVINADDPHALALARSGRARRLHFSVDTPVDEGVFVQARTVTYRHAGRDEPLIPLSAIALKGRHLLADVAAAAAVAKLAGVPAAAMTRAVESFEGLEHVLEQAGAVGSVRFVNDSKATNIAAARLAIESFGPGLVVILGGRHKGGDFRALRAPLVARGARVVAIGEARPLIHAALAPEVPVMTAGSMAEAVRQAFACVEREGGTVLLAPACASLDMFEDYADRGRAFKQAVVDLRTERAGRED
jgi:UDP-N-acetylmuramoylalanine--D-glutamate ligase